MPVRFLTPAGGGFLALFSRVRTVLPHATRKRLGRWIVDTIRDRTESGVSSEGSRFAPYSPAYAAMKGSTKVNLRVTGQMLKQVRIVKNTTRSLTIGITGSRKGVAAKHQGGIGVPARPFFGLTRGERKDFRRELKDELRQVIRRAK